MTSAQFPVDPVPLELETLAQSTRRTWALGDYDRFAKALVWSQGEVLVDACFVGPGQKVLDIATGTGNAALRAAQRGADVTAVDICGANLPAAAANALALGVSVDWREGDAQALALESQSYDVVISCLGAIFAPYHALVAAEMARVCRPGGTIAMLAFAPVGTAAAFFELFARYLPPLPEGGSPPLQWGDPGHVERMFAGKVRTVSCTDHSYFEHAESPAAYQNLIATTFGPAVAIRQALAQEPHAKAQFDADFERFTEEHNDSPNPAAARYRYDCLLIVAER